MKKPLILKTLINKIIKMPGTDLDCYQVESWNRETDCYVLSDWNKNYKPLIISRDYLMLLLDNNLAKILI